MYLAGVVVFKVFFAILFVLKWQCRYATNKNYKISEYNLERTFKELKKGKEDAESTDDVEDRRYLNNVTMRREKTIKHKSRHLYEAGGRRKLAKAEMLNQAKKIVLEDDILLNNDDSDDDRMDFVDAEIQEITDRIVREYRRKKRPLKASELEKMSHGLVDNVRDSVLSNVMAPAEYQFLQSSQNTGFKSN